MVLLSEGLIEIPDSDGEKRIRRLRYFVWMPRDKGFDLPARLFSGVQRHPKPASVAPNNFEESAESMLARLDAGSVQPALGVEKTRTPINEHNRAATVSAHLDLFNSNRKPLGISSEDSNDLVPRS